MEGILTGLMVWFAILGIAIIVVISLAITYGILTYILKLCMRIEKRIEGRFDENTRRERTNPRDA